MHYKVQSFLFETIYNTLSRTFFLFLIDISNETPTCYFSMHEGKQLVLTSDYFISGRRLRKPKSSPFVGRLLAGFLFLLIYEQEVVHHVYRNIIENSRIFLRIFVLWMPVNPERPKIEFLFCRFLFSQVIKYCGQFFNFVHYCTVYLKPFCN